jgi:hypothetical protein
MWIFAPFGVLMPAKRPEKYTPVGDLKTMQIRSRRGLDLDILRALYMQGQLGPTIHTPDKDYEYRAYCKPEDFAWAMFEMVTKIDYTKFKPETDNFADAKLHSFYTSVWSLYLSQISTKRHQHEYWRSESSRYSGPDYYNRSRNATYPHKNANGTVPTVPALASGPTTVELPPFSEVHEKHTGTGYPAHRGSAADRDEYVPETWDSPTQEWPEEGSAASASSDLLEEVDAILDAHYDSTAEVLGFGDHAAVDDPDDDDGTPEARLSHSECNHGFGEAAKRRCTRRRRRTGSQTSA